MNFHLLDAFKECKEKEKAQKAYLTATAKSKPGESPRRRRSPSEKEEKEVKEKCAKCQHKKRRWKNMRHEERCECLLCVSNNELKKWQDSRTTKQGKYEADSEEDEEFVQILKKEWDDPQDKKKAPKLRMFKRKECEDQEGWEVGEENEKELDTHIRPKFQGHHKSKKTRNRKGMFRNALWTNHVCGTRREYVAQTTQEIFSSGMHRT